MDVSTPPMDVNQQCSNHLPHSNLRESPTPSSWQFSLRTLLFVTALVSVCMAIGVHLAGVLFALAIAVLVQVAMLLSADWLIRPENRRVLAFVTAASWVVLGSGLVAIGVREVYINLSADGGFAAWTLAGSMIAAGAYCYYLAATRWRRLTRRPSMES